MVAVDMDGGKVAQVHKMQVASCNPRYNTLPEVVSHKIQKRYTFVRLYVVRNT